MSEPSEPGEGLDAQELRTRLRSALSGFLAGRDSEDVDRLCADVLASIHGVTVVERLRSEQGVEAGAALDLSDDGAPAGSGSSLLERLQEPGEGGGRYHILGEEARGGMGVILRVWDRELRRSLAMKVAIGDVDGAEGSAAESLDSVSIARFLEEAQVTGQLDHPGIVPVHELGLDERGRVFFTMRLVKGRTFKDVFAGEGERDGEWTRERILDAFVRCCEAVSFAHAKGVVHRDLKPANVMVGCFGEVYVMDWGLAKVTGRSDGHDLRWRESGSTGQVLTDLRQGSGAPDDSPLMTMDGAVMGTPAYMPPEQARGEVDRIDGRSDVYALGSMLYELLTGSPPYVPADGRITPRTVLAALLAGPPESVTELAPGAPPELVAVCEKAMSREPDERYGDVSELVADLRAFQDGRVVRAYEAGPLAELRKWVARNRRFAAALACTVLVALGGLATVGWVNARGRAEVLRMADAKRVRDYTDEASSLWPAWPEQLDALRAWRDKARALHANLPVHEAALAELEAMARPDGASGLAFDSDEDAWRQETLAGLVDRLRAMGVVGDGLIADVERRIATAEEVHARTVDDHRAAWEEAIRSIADEGACPRYGGRGITPQLGLIPLWRSAAGLWEFALWGSGALPAEAGAVAEGDAVVLVLLPGGTFTMGATSFDRYAQEVEEPAHPVTLDRFFISKYEVTQAQWARMGGASRGYFRPDTYSPWIADATHPIELVSWFEATEVLWRHGLVLPTEARWEYAARAGTDTAWFWGGKQDLVGERDQGLVNIADRAGLESTGLPIYAHYLTWKSLHPTVEREAARRERGMLAIGPLFQPTEPMEYRDGFAVHAPVGSFPPNAFGLHDLHGNVFEWCRDGVVGYDVPPSPRDGLREGPGVEKRCVRGGGWNRSYYLSRSAAREEELAHNELTYVGVRAARALLD